MVIWYEFRMRQYRDFDHQEVYYKVHRCKLISYSDWVNADLIVSVFVSKSKNRSCERPKRFYQNNTSKSIRVFANLSTDCSHHCQKYLHIENNHRWKIFQQHDLKQNLAWLCLSICLLLNWSFYATFNGFYIFFVAFRGILAKLNQFVIPGYDILTPHNCPFRGHSVFERISVNLFWKLRKIFLGRILSFIKNVPSRDNCPWQVTLRAPFLGS